MNRYTMTKKLGDGTYGSVLKAVNRQTGEEVAVKKMKKLFTRQVPASTHNTFKPFAPHFGGNRVVESMCCL